jgi:hypothetical protein
VPLDETVHTVSGAVLSTLAVNKRHISIKRRNMAAGDGSQFGTTTVSHSASSGCKHAVIDIVMGARHCSLCPLQAPDHCVWLMYIIHYGWQCCTQFSNAWPMMLS